MRSPSGEQKIDALPNHQGSIHIEHDNAFALTVDVLAGEPGIRAQALGRQKQIRLERLRIRDAGHVEHKLTGSQVFLGQSADAHHVGAMAGRGMAQLGDERCGGFVRQKHQDRMIGFLEHANLVRRQGANVNGQAQLGREGHDGPEKPGCPFGIVFQIDEKGEGQKILEGGLLDIDNVDVLGGERGGQRAENPRAVPARHRQDERLSQRSHARDESIKSPEPTRRFTLSSKKNSFKQQLNRVPKNNPRISPRTAPDGKGCAN